MIARYFLPLCTNINQQQTRKLCYFPQNLVLRSCLIALYFDPTTLMEIAVSNLYLHLLCFSSLVFLTKKCEIKCMKLTNSVVHLYRKTKGRARKELDEKVKNKFTSMRVKHL